MFAEVTDVFPKLGLWVTWEFMKELTMRRTILDHMFFLPTKVRGLCRLDHPRTRGQNTSYFPNRALPKSWLFYQSKNSEHWTVAVLQRQSDSLIIHLNFIEAQKHEKTSKILLILVRNLFVFLEAEQEGTFRV